MFYLHIICKRYGTFSLPPSLPHTGVDVRLSDYGVSQFSTPCGLWKQKGTEDYMAPELREKDNMAYDEKVAHVLFSLSIYNIPYGMKYVYWQELY